jgi:hypothetical protein
MLTKAVSSGMSLERKKLKSEVALVQRACTARHLPLSLVLPVAGCDQ